MYRLAPPFGWHGADLEGLVVLVEHAQAGAMRLLRVIDQAVGASSGWGWCLASHLARA